MKMSIFTPTYNTGPLLYRTYLSVQRQSHANWEWVIVDDGSDERTRAILAEISYQDPRVRVSFEERSGSIGRMKALCTERCSGSILVELDHDDMLVPTALHQIHHASINEPDAGMFYSNFAEVLDDGTCHRYQSPYWAYKEVFVGATRYWEALAPDVYAQSHGLKAPNICYWPLMPNHVRAFRKTALDMVGGYDPALDVADDYDLIWRFYLHSQIVHIPKLLYLYRWGANTWSGERNAELQLKMAAVRAKYAHHIGWNFAADDVGLL